MAKKSVRLMTVTPVVTLLLLSWHSNGITPSINSIVLLLAVLFSLWIAWKIFLYPQFFSPLRYLPQSPPASSVRDRLKGLVVEPSVREILEWMETVPNDGLIRYLGALNTERLLVTSAEGLTQVMQTKAYDFVRLANIRNRLGRILGRSVLLTEGEEHKIQRKHMMPAFTFRHIKDLYPIFWSKSVELVSALANQIASSHEMDEKLPSSAIVNMHLWARSTTLDVLGVAGLGQDFGGIQNPEVELTRVYHKMLTPSKGFSLLYRLSFILPLWILTRLPLKRNREIDEGVQVIRRCARLLISSKKAQKAEAGETPVVDILSVMIDSGVFDDEDLVEQLMTFLAGGHETTAAALSWAVYLLCKNPDVQRRLHEEVRAELPAPGSGTSVTAAKLDALPYLRAVCNEVLRFYPSIPVICRETARDTTILGQHVPVGIPVTIAVWAINRSRSHWGSNAREFDPERWLGPGKAGSGGASSTFSFMTFSHGPRNCIGQSFARGEMAALIAGLVRQFYMELQDEDEDIPMVAGIVGQPAKKIFVRLTMRDDW